MSTAESRLVLIALGALLSLAVDGRADVLVFPGVHPSLQDAIDAATDGDTILLTSGNLHPPITVAGKGLTFVGDGVQTPITQVIVQDLQPQQTVVLRNIVFAGYAAVTLDQRNGLRIGETKPRR